jgi:putative phosphoribosyl transferase
MSVQFRDREEAGRLLAQKFAAYTDRSDVTVLALPGGGVAVASEIAEALHAPLDVFLVRKLSVPGFNELAMGAIAAGGIQVIQPEMVEAFNLSAQEVRHVVAAEERELERRERIYRACRPPLDVRDRVVIVVDDGMTTGSTMRVAIEALKRLKPARTIVATAVAPLSTYLLLGTEADEVICLATPREFRAAGEFYRVFPQLSDRDVCDLLERSRDAIATF